MAKHRCKVRPQSDDSPLSVDVLIVGAGFSYAATRGQTPLMKGYFDKVSERQYPRLYGLIKACGHDTASANVEEILAKLQSNCEASGGWAETWCKDELLIYKELTNYTRSRLASTKFSFKDNFAAFVMGSQRKSTTVISLNYDDVAEKVLACRDGLTHLIDDAENPSCPHCRMLRLMNHACDCDTRQDVTDSSFWKGALLKPHGSLAWKRCVNPDCCRLECLTPNPQATTFADYRCRHCCECSVPVMVMPNMTKNLDDIPEIATIWRCTELALANAETVAFYGFSLPPSDSLFKQMVIRAFAAGNRIRRVSIVDPCHVSVERRVRDLLPHGLSVEIVAAGPPLAKTA